MKVTNKCDDFRWFSIVSICLKGNENIIGLYYFLKGRLHRHKNLKHGSSKNVSFSLQLQPTHLYSVLSNCFLLMMPNMSEQYLQRGRLARLT